MLTWQQASSNVSAHSRPLPDRRGARRATVAHTTER